MSSILNRFSLQQKLIMLTAIPVLLFLIFGSLRMGELMNRYRMAQGNVVSVSITRQVEAAIVAIQKERALSIDNIGGNDEKIRRQLLVQQQASDRFLLALLEPLELAKPLQSAEPQISRSINLRQYMPQLRSMVNQLPTVRQWSDEQSALSLFQFYSKLNQHLLRLIAQLQMLALDTELVQAYGDLLAMLRIQELVAKERGLMKLLIATEPLDLKAYIAMNEVDNALGLAVEEIGLSVVSQRHISIEPSLDKHFTERLQLMRVPMQGQLEWVAMANRLRAVLGYGVMEYASFSPELYIKAFDLKIKRVLSVLDDNDVLQHLSTEQADVVGQLINEVKGYQRRFELLVSRQQQDGALRESASLVELEKSMIIRLSQLLQLTPTISGDPWWQVSSQEIERLYQFNAQLIDNIAQIGTEQKRDSLVYLLLAIVAALASILILIFFGRYIVNNLIQRITTISTLMHQMSHDTEVQLTVPVDGSDEVAKMSMALNNMLSERLKANRQLNLASAVFEYCAEGIVVTDKDNLIEAVNPAFTEITGYSVDEVKGLSPSVLKSSHQPNDFYLQMWDALNKHGKWRGEIWNKRKNGQVYPEYLAITVVKDDQGQVLQHIGLFLDISSRKKYEKDLWYKTNYDPLTNLPNRQLYRVRLSQMLQLAEQASCSIALLFIDLDRFKYINDIYGHTLGDELLQVVAVRLESLLDQNDFVARLSGDEFVVVMGQIKHLGQIEARTKEILQHLSSPFGIDRNELLISASIGISCYPSNGSDVEVLTRNAETAMYQAKQEGRNSFSYFSADMNTSMLERIALEQSLRSAVLQQQFCLHYQPIAEIQTGQIVAVEALIRWQHPKQGLVAPDQFIPIAEETGLIEPIGEWVLQQALSDLAHWHSEGYMINMAINVSGRQLVKHQYGYFSSLIKALLQKHHLPPQALHIEITESMLMDDTEKSLNALNSIRALGVEIYLDDFGTGYSSLSYLKRFPISVIKIDKSFVDNMLEDPADANLIKAIITMGQSLDMKLVAEGVETQSQQEFLQRLGCDYSQGYLISKPLESESLLALLAQRSVQQLAKV